MLLLIIFLSLTLLGFLSWVLPLYPFLVFVLAILLSNIVVVLLIKKMAGWAVKSVIAWTILASLFGYWFTTRQIKKDMEFMPPTSNTKVAERKDIVGILKKQGFTHTLAREAADYVLQQIPDQSLSEKLRMALQYLDNGHQPSGRQLKSG